MNLLKHKLNKNEEVYIFDVDHTLIKQSTARCFLTEGLLHRIIKFRHLIKLPFQFALYKLALLDPSFIEDQIKILKGKEIEILKELSLKSFKRQGKGQLYTDAIKLINTLKSNGHRIIIATTSADFLITPLAEFLDINEVICTRLETHNGIITGKAIGKPLFGDEKRLAVESYLKEHSLAIEKATFYSDSYNDLPLLSKCGKAVPTNPDRRLFKEAAKKGWECLFFKERLG